jgi:hypothetical protein
VYALAHKIVVSLKKGNRMTEDTKNRRKSSTRIVNVYSGYDNYIAVDWSQKSMAIARISKNRPNKVRISEHPSNYKELQRMLGEIEGRRILVLEESSPAHWLYLQLHDYAEKIVICDPYRNRLLSDGPKNDPIDAGKLCMLLYSGMIKEIYHSQEKVFELRKYVSSYMDLVKMGVRVKNQRTGFLSQECKSKKMSEQIETESTGFVLDLQTEQISLYETQKEKYEKLFKKLCKENKTLKHLCSIPGIAEISAVKILAMMVDAKRFCDVRHYLAYCGLVSHIIESGGKVYGRRRPRYCRVLKDVYKTAVATVINGNSPLRKTYEYYLNKGISEHNARHALARYIARISFGIVKTETEFNGYNERKAK